jgi:ComF family protein
MRFVSTMGILKQFSQAAIAGVFPPRCAGCDGWDERLFCDDCRLQLRVLQGPLCTVCGKPFDPLAFATLCAECRPSRNNKPPEFPALRSCFAFDGPSREAIHRYKYQGQSSLVHLLAQELADFWARDCNGTLQTSHCDLMTPVPLHWWRAYRRGYNQSELLANQLSLKMDVPSKVLLRRVKPTRPQVELDRGQRAENVKNAFQIEATHAELIKAKTILLIDDVCTTGATLRECAKALKKGGAAAVYALTVARQIPSSHTGEEPRA